MGISFGGSRMIAPPTIPESIAQPGYQDEGRDKFEHVKDNPLKLVKEDPVSTFSIDVDTASYAFARASLNQNVLPQNDSVRIEEMVNYFPYDYALPKEKTAPFATHVSVMPTPWNKGTKLVHIGIKGYDVSPSAKPHSNLVFLIDTSGSMTAPNKLPLLKSSLKLLLDSLQADDTVAIVTYAGNAGIALEPTKVADKAKILSVIDSFNSGGSTAGAEGIRQAYQLAERNFDKKGVNRVILATDGDFNVGITDQNELKSFIERKRDSGVFLSVLGFGMGNYNDAMMQTLAQNGNGNAAYIDTLSEARKVLVEEAGSTLFTIAKDVKIQVEFNPAQVAEYRLIGYETRMLKREDFNNDKIDAGEIGAGHAVTAMYEITPTQSDAKLVDDLRYGADKKVAAPKSAAQEYAFLKIRYKLPKEDTSKLITTPIDATVEVPSIEKASTDARFATAVAAFGQLLRGEGMTKNFTYDDVAALAESAKGEDKFGYRAEFINLVRLAKSAAGMKPLEGGQRPTATMPSQPVSVLPMTTPPVSAPPPILHPPLGK
ncbi:MAG: VWA domain-containing protein [Pseudomonadota bacterium]